MRKHSTILIIISNLLFCSAEEYLSEIQSLTDSSLYKQAEKKINLALQDYNASAKLFFIGGEIAIKLDNLDEANKYLIKAIELDNKNKTYRSTQEKLEKLKNLLTSSRKTFDSGNYEDAIIEHENIATNFPENAIVFYNLGRIYKVNNDYNSAVNNYKKAIELNPFEEKYKKAVIAVAQEMTSNGDIEYRRQEFDSAMDYYNKSLHYAPKYAPTYFKVANVYRKLQDIDKAIELLKIGLSYDSSYAKIHLMLGKLYKKKDKIKLAKISINSAININSNYTKAYFELGQIYFNENNYDFAIKEYQNAINSDSTYKRAYLTLGLCEMNIKNYDNAELYYSKAFSLDDKYIDAYYRLSEVYNLQQRYKEAKEMAKKAIYVKQNYAPALYELGFAEMHLCNIVAAKDAFEKAKKDRSIRPSANKYLKDIGYYTKDCN